MDLETATDLVDVAFEAFGIQDAVYQAPDGAADVACVVIVWEPWRAGDMMGVRAGAFAVAERASYVLVRKSQLASPVSGGVFVGDGLRYTISDDEAPVRHDMRGLVWRCPCGEGEPDSGTG